MSSKFLRGAPILLGDNTTPGVRIPKELQDQIPTIFDACRNFGLDFYPTVIQMLTWDEISEIAAYGGFPVRYPHWSFGMEYEELQQGYEFGMHRIYEMVINCLDPNSKILTTKGSRLIKDVQVGDLVFSNNGFRKVVFTKSQNKSNVYKIYLDEFLNEPICTNKHKWLCYRDGESVWIETRNLTSNDVIFAGGNYYDYLNKPCQIDWSKENVWNETRPNIRHRLRDITPPTAMTLELAELLGVCIGDGSIGARWARNNIDVCVYNKHIDYVNHVVKLFQNVFGLSATLRDRKTTTVVSMISKYAVDFFDYLGAAKGCTYNDKRIPKAIWDSSHEFRAAFLRGLFDTDGHCGSNLILSCKNVDLARDVQLLLLEMGIRSKVKHVVNKHNNIHIITIKGKANLLKYRQYIGFKLDYKFQGLSVLCDRRGSCAGGIFLPGLKEKIVELINSMERPPEWGINFVRRNKGKKMYSNSLLDLVMRFIEAGYDQFDGIYQTLSTPFYEVTRVELQDEQMETVDIGLEDGKHDFLANGLVSHNTNPCYIYCLDSNSLLDNVTVIAHALGHNDFFKNNLYFSCTNTDMLNKMANHGTRIRRYMSRWGKEKVSEFLDHVLRLQTLIDPAKAWDKKIVKDIQVFDKRDYKQPNRLKYGENHEYMDEWINPPEWRQKQLKEIEEEEQSRQLGIHFDSTKDILGFLKDHAPLKLWQADIVSMIYEEAMYFAPQRATKTINEGFASWTDHNIIAKQGFASLGQKTEDAGIIEYALHKMGVLGGKYSMNPYKLGYCLLEDIEDRWNKGRFGKEYNECTNIKEKEDWDKNLGLGKDKVFEVRKYYNDISLIDEFFTEEFCNKYEFFEWKKYGNEYKIESRDHKKIKNKLIGRYANGGLPEISLVDDNYKGRGYMLLEHNWTGRILHKHVVPVLQSIWHLWKNDVVLVTKEDDQEAIYYCSGPNDDDVDLLSREEFER